CLPSRATLRKYRASLCPRIDDEEDEPSTGKLTWSPVGTVPSDEAPVRAAGDGAIAPAPSSDGFAGKRFVKSPLAKPTEKSSGCSSGMDCSWTAAPRSRI